MDNGLNKILESPQLINSISNEKISISLLIKKLTMLKNRELETIDLSAILPTYHFINRKNEELANVNIKNKITRILTFSINDIINILVTIQLYRSHICLAEIDQFYQKILSGGIIS